MYDSVASCVVGCKTYLSPDARIEVIFEAPTEIEIEKQQPLAGKIGDLFARIIYSAGYERAKCNVNYLSKRSVGSNYISEQFRESFYRTVELPTYTKTGKVSKKTHKISQKTEEYEAYIDLLRNQLYQSKPNVVVACGENVLNALCGVSNILNYRGSVLESSLIPGLKVIPVVAPHWIYETAQWEYVYITIGDFKKAVHESEFPEIRKIPYDAIIAPSFDDVVEYLNWLASEKDLRWSFDIETRAGSISCLGFCAADRAICIPIQSTTGPCWSASAEAAIWRAVGRVFAANGNLVGQNLNYDLDWMLDHGIEAKDVFLDTMIGQFILTPELPKGLDYICSIHTDAIYYKEEGKTWGSKIPDEQLWKYNCKDTWYTLQASYSIEERLKAQGLWKLWENYGRRLIDVALEIQKRGVQIDLPAKDAAKEIIIQEYKALRETVVSTLGREINVSSPKAVQDYLMNELKVPLKRKRIRKIKTKTAPSFTADEDTLMGLLVKDLPKKYQGKVDPNYKEKIRLIMKERHLRKAGNYVGIKIKSGGAWETDPLFCDADNVVRSQINIPGTKTWRFSMQESPHGTGWNLQTAPKQLRTYAAPDGRIFLQPDQKQAEARVVAALAMCKKQLENFSNPSWSIHMDLGRDIFKRELMKDTPEYTAAKSGVHGGNFRMMAERLAKTTGVPVHICEIALNGYHSKYPEIRFNFHEGVKREILNKGYLENPFGLRRYFFHAIGGVRETGVFNNDDWNDACSWIPQSTVPYITNLTLLNVCDILNYVWIHQQGHDAFLISVPEGCEEETSNVILAEGSKISCSIKGFKLNIPWEMTMGYTWGNMYEHYTKLTRTDWETLVAGDVKKGKSGTREAILKGIYGIL